jgi:hypothetical protein
MRTLAGGPAASARRRVNPRVLLAALPLASGAGLVVYILAGVSLPLAVAALAALGLAVWAVLVPRLNAGLRMDVRRRVAIGAAAGLAGTLAYDAARYGTVALLDFSFRPFHVFELFGHLFLGPAAGHGAALAVGTLYHLTNGTCFGIAYLLVFRNPGVLSGMLWGAALELCMATLYPSWLRIQQFAEFLQVSAVGHLVYGAVLGALGARLLGARPLSARGGEPAP